MGFRAKLERMWSRPESGRVVKSRVFRQMFPHFTAVWLMGQRDPKLKKPRRLQPIGSKMRPRRKKVM